MRNIIKMTQMTNCYCIPANTKPARAYDIIKKKGGKFITRLAGATNEEAKEIAEAETFEEARKTAKERGVKLEFFEVA